MAGNSRRRGAIRKSGSKKGPTVGSGGQGRGRRRGPTPKAEDRVGHKAHQSSNAGKPSEGTRRSTSSPRPARKRHTKDSAEFVAGRNAVIEALRTDMPVMTMYVAGQLERDDRITEALRAAAERSFPVLETTRPELDRLTDGAVHQGIAIRVPPYDYLHPDDLLSPRDDGPVPDSPTLIVALDGITDPRNLGAIVRSVAAFGGHGVVVPARRSVGMTASAWKTSAGAAARIPVARAVNLTRALQDYRSAGCHVIGLDMHGDVDLPQFDDAFARGRLVVVVGSEGKGLSRLVRETCDQVVSIPMSSAVESLNAGMAVAVTLHDVARRRNAQFAQSVAKSPLDD